MRYLILLLLASCTFKQTPPERRSTGPLSDKWSLYHDLLHKSGHVDEYQTVYRGDSTLFSCLGYAAGVLDLDPEIFLKDGKIIRHPKMTPATNIAPVSKDMMEGFFWCIMKSKRLDLAEKVINYGKKNTVLFGDTEVGWSFCSEKDRKDYNLDQQTWVGTCIMTPGMIGDLYRMAMKFGYKCDATCEHYKGFDIELSYLNTGYARHLAVIKILRNGFLHGKIEQDAYNVLRKAVTDNPRNVLYQAAFAHFNGGDMSAAIEAAMDESLFPNYRLPDHSNYKADYLFQRDEDSTDKFGEYNWKPTLDPTPKLRGFEWLVGASAVLNVSMGP